MQKQELVAVFVFVCTVLFIYSLEFLFFIKFLNKKILKQNNGIKGRYFVLHSIALSGLCCMLYGYFIEPYWIEVNHVSIYTKKLQKTSFRIVQISDLHCDPVVRAEKSLIQKIADLKPDIVVFTGDCINSPEGLAVFQNTMSQIKTRYGKFAVLGNWDTKWRNLDRFSKTGFRVLYDDETICSKEGENIKILGLSYYSPDFPKKFFSLEKESFRIFLYHYPDLIEDIDREVVSLYLCGHVHGGQVALPFYGALITLVRHGKKYEAGLYPVENTLLYVNRGIGMEGGKVPRVRFFSRPEITVFDIMPEK